MSDIGNKTKSGLFFKFAERISVELVTFIVSVILARLLLPEQFGTITLVGILISILDVFIQHGFGNSLIVNKQSDDLDFSTCFHFGLALSLFIYAVVFVGAPYISIFFDNPELTNVIRVMCLRIPIGAVNSVQHAWVSKHMIFKKFFISTSVGTISSGIIAVIMALSGFGVWSLVAQYLSNALIDTVCLRFIIDWRPKLIFSFNRLKAIYNYGWKILATGLIDTFYSRLRDFIIAKKYTTADLAFYGKGIAFPNMGMQAIEPTIDGVIFPALSNCNDDKVMMKSITRRMIKTTSYIIFPMMVALFIVAKPLVVVILTEKWLESVVYLQIGCLAYIFRPIQVINNCVIRASGNSALLLKLDILKKSLGVIILLLSIPFGVKYVALSFAIVNIISMIINIWPNRSILNYGYMEQIKDLIPSFMMALTMGLFMWFCSFAQLNSIATLITQILVGLLSYWILSVVTQSEPYCYLVSMINNTLKNKKLS